MANDSPAQAANTCRASMAPCLRVIAPLVVFIVTFASPLFPRSLEVGAGLSRQKMGAHFDYYIDRTGKAGMQEVLTRACQDKFRSLPKEDYSFGFTDAAIWLRAVVVNRTGQDYSWVLECGYPLIDDICLYTQQRGMFVPVCTGDLTPFTTRPIRSRTFQFPITSPPGESAYYVRMSSGGALHVSFAAWSRTYLREQKTRESILLWIYYGIMIAFIIYNLFIFFSVRDLSYLYLSLFTVSMSLATMSLNGLAFQYLWPDAPAWGNIANLVFSSFNCVFAIPFTRSFLDTRIKIPRYDRFLLGYLAYIIACFLLLFGKYRYAAQVISFNTGAIQIILIVCGIYLLIKGSRQAKYYMLAWMCVLAGSLLMVLHTFGLIHEGYLSTWGVQIGMSLLVILLSLGVADKINTMRDEREHALEATRDAEEKYRALIETTNTGYVILDERGRVVDANDAYVRLTGHRTLDDILNRSVAEWTDPADREKNLSAVEEVVRQGFIRNLEIDYLRKDGTTLPVEINGTTVDSRQGRRILSICRDITYRRTAFQNLIASLREKDILLKEVHHRVKNNMQIISSLLNLQSNKITDSDTLRMYQDMNNRIRAMAIIHERMYKTSDFARVDLADYLKTIAYDLRSTYAVSCPECGMQFDTMPVLIEITQAIPCGLIINEILSNIFKYAFPASFAGHPAISIGLHEVDDSEVVLAIGDNGVGLPEAVIPGKTDSLGLSLIHLLASQLRGTVAIDRAGGTKYTIQFRLTVKK